MNPFDLRGPEFLFFYLVFTTVVVVCAAFLRRMKEAGPAPKMDLDPYGIAYLRGGKNETIRVAIVSLIDRGLLTASGTKVQRAPQASPAAVRHSLEKALLQKCASPCEAADLFKGSSLETVCYPYEVALAEYTCCRGHP